MRTHLTITQASVTAAVATVIGWIVAFVPAFGPDKQNLIAAGTTVVAAVFLLANAIHKLADSNVSTKDVETGAIEAARAELGRVDFTSLVKDAVDTKSIPDLEDKVKTEVQTLVAGLFGEAAVKSAAASPAPVTETAQAPAPAAPDQLQPLPPPPAA